MLKDYNPQVVPILFLTNQLSFCQEENAHFEGINDYLGKMWVQVIFFLCLSLPGGKLQTCGIGTHIVPVAGQVEWVGISDLINTDLREAR